MNPGATLRAAAAQALAKIVAGQSRRAVFAPTSSRFADARDRALLAALLSEGARWWLRFAAAIDGMVERPIRSHELKALLVLGLVQLEILQLPEYAAVAATVDATRAMNQAKFSGFVNALLRRWLRERTTLLARLDADAVTRTAHPAWLIAALRRAYPNQFGAILDSGNREAPLWLRVNRRRGSRDALMQRFSDNGIVSETVDALPDALVLRESADVTRLPGFAEGLFSVQDGAAQHAAPLLDLRDGLRVLDACAAPGGKTAHILETADVDVVALDNDQTRLVRVDENLQRLGLRATLQTGDAAQPNSWWDGRPFDRILLDAPCSATGILRRQPDIKLHRRDTDVPPLVALQAGILDALWPLLARGGRLVYATCSILPDENGRQLDAFLARHADAKPLPVTLPWHGQGIGTQNLPGESGMDGFFYAMVEKYN